MQSDRPRFPLGRLEKPSSVGLNEGQRREPWLLTPLGYADRLHILRSLELLVPGVNLVRVQPHIAERASATDFCPRRASDAIFAFSAESIFRLVSSSLSPNRSG
jgi:hypothetical protein